MVKRNPRGAARAIEHQVEQRPVRYRVGPVLHAFGFAIRARDRSRVEVIAADHDRRLELARAHHLVEREAREVTLAEPDPADARRQPLEFDAPGGHVEPPVEQPVLGKKLTHLRVGPGDVFGVAGERRPAERAPADAEQRPHVGRNETGKVERVLHAGVFRLLADVVAVVHARNAERLEAEHRAHVVGDGFAGRERNLFGIAPAQVPPAFERPVLRQVAVCRIMRRGLVGDEGWVEARRLRELKQLRHEFRRIAKQSDGHRRG